MVQLIIERKDHNTAINTKLANILYEDWRTDDSLVEVCYKSHKVEYILTNTRKSNPKRNPEAVLLGIDRNSPKLEKWLENINNEVPKAILLVINQEGIIDVMVGVVEINRFLQNNYN
ncbi:hypothetical protein KMW28_12915 [Flammeovirga yaeyamensis]|uniref:Uncharacterized protein n=1 Tax=Flammeovirga yaeyamensis TaxID=367791 RepID=A0AAX1MZ04_9BACT|nr:hypothetical protein [Flammeovirga yaeyamensis]MBB3695929.1 hypothetical protein [Flammeovirga yaeyamensis]NMF34617.1 hypothetical protein [Flammeovirga yaeyamensis]QWG00553.1 hypothetical protein KMW28_12915 [Flammeovirga yaeyamensis]